MNNATEAPIPIRTPCSTTSPSPIDSAGGGGTGRYTGSSEIATDQASTPVNARKFFDVASGDPLFSPAV
jgi:hypothetical protein